MPVVGAFLLPHGCLCLDPERIAPALPATPLAAARSLHAALAECGRRIAALAPTTFVLVTPHACATLARDWAVIANEGGARGTAEWDGAWSEFTAEIALCGAEEANALAAHLHSALNSAASADASSADINDCASSEPAKNDTPGSVQAVTVFGASAAAPLRWGEVVPCCFLPRSLSSTRFVLLSPPARRMRPTSAFVDECSRVGAAVASFYADNGKHGSSRDGSACKSAGHRTVLLVSGDLAHTHAHACAGHPSPYASHADAQPFDNQVLAWARAYNFVDDEIASATDLGGGGLNQGATKRQSIRSAPMQHLHAAAALAPTALACGLAGCAFLAGALDWCRGQSSLGSKSSHQPLSVSVRSDILAYAHPTYYGMACIEFQLPWAFGSIADAFGLSLSSSPSSLSNVAALPVQRRCVGGAFDRMLARVPISDWQGQGAKNDGPKQEANSNAMTPLRFANQHVNCNRPLLLVAGASAGKGDGGEVRGAEWSATFSIDAMCAAIGDLPMTNVFASSSRRFLYFRKEAATAPAANASGSAASDTTSAVTTPDGVRLQRCTMPFGYVDLFVTEQSSFYCCCEIFDFFSKPRSLLCMCIYVSRQFVTEARSSAAGSTAAHSSSSSASAGSRNMYLYGEPVTAAMRERLPFPQPAMQCLDERARQALTSTLLWAAVECVF
jgi:aromatic ring-opening dioxygenase LigB subunit